MIKLKLKILTLMLLLLSPSVTLAAGLGDYLNNISLFAVLVVGFLILMLFIWGIFKVAMAIKKIPDLQEQGGDQQAKTKIVLGLVSGIAAIGFPILLIAGIITFFGADNALKMVLPDNADTSTIEIFDSITDKTGG